jgi:phosphoribosyl 1,2-cyclic phosphate phosphodiesterase
MKFTLTGSGTSQGVPVIGCQCPVCQSSDPRDQRLRTSGVLESETTTLVFDTGPDFRQQMLRADIRQLDGVVFTHEHNDHTAGLDDLRPFIFRQRKDMPLFATERVLQFLRQSFAYAFAEDRYPGAPSFEVNLIEDQPFELGDIRLEPIPLWHGKLPVLGFRIDNFAYLTDTNNIPEASIAKLQGLDFLLLDALHHRKHYSHFTLEEAIQAVQRIQPKCTYFLHISHLMGLHADIEAQLPDDMHLAYDGLEVEW